MFKPGSIRKVQVENFVTYAYTEMYPGPNLNMLIGPNGTGKSTMVAAIILGLGGNPKTVGRGSKISEYIKHGCNVATINIHLQGRAENETVKTTREFGADEKSMWRINDKKVSGKEFVEFVRRFDIQVDNLCQFLPQDRVQDFAKLNKRELLKQTQIAICRTDLMEKQEQLINARVRHKKLVSSIQKLEDKFAEATEAKLQLQGKVKNFKKKREYSTKVKNIERKVAWMMYDLLKDRLDEVRQVRKKAQNDVVKKREEAQPLQTAVNNARRMIETLMGKIANLSNQIRAAQNRVIADIEESEGSKQSIRRLEREKVNMLAMVAQQAAEIRGVEEELQKVQSDKEALLENNAEQTLEQKLQRYHSESTKLQQHVRALEATIDELADKKRNKFSEVRYLQNQLTRLENTKQQRLEKLRLMDADAYTAVNWLRANRHLFKGEVFEPMMLEINVLNPEHSVFLENVISRRDKVAFTCTHKDDMALLIRALRQTQNLKVSVLHSGNDGMTVHDFVPSIPIEQLRRYGFFSYLNSLFTAPDPIMKYLCRIYNVHNIPIGTEATNRHFQEVPKHITVFFSSDFRYTATHSRYTGEKSIRQNAIGSDGTLSISVDALRLEQIRGQIGDVQAGCDRCESQINDVRIQVTQVNEKIAVVREKSASVENKMRQLQGFASRTRILQNKLEGLRRNAQSEEEIERNTGSQIQNVIKAMIDMQSTIPNHYKAFLEKVKRHKLEGMKLTLARKEVDYLTNSNQQKQREIQTAEQNLENLTLVYNDIRNKEREALQSARSLSNNCNRDDPGFEEFRQSYEELTGNVEELEAEKEELQTRIDCLRAANDGEMAEYEARETEIQDLEVRIREETEERENLEQLLSTSQEQWLNPLQEVVEQVNVRFGAAFEHMGCAGEISLSRGADERDYEEYGLSVKVSYRDEEPLQELNSTVQSGGERAVATAAFMLSLQELTPVPFRCVDEINQGMDPTNERRIFELLVDLTSRPNTAQYFLITPKLVPGLKFVSTMKVHIVHNGPFLAPAKEWSKTRLCNPAGV